MDILKMTRRAHQESDFLWFCPAVSWSGLRWDGNVGLKSILCISPMLKVRKVGRVTADNVRGGRSWLLSFYIPCIHSKNAYCKITSSSEFLELIYFLVFYQNFFFHTETYLQCLTMFHLPRSIFKSKNNVMFCFCIFSFFPLSFYTSLLTVCFRSLSGKDRKMCGPAEPSG